MSLDLSIDSLEEEVVGKEFLWTGETNETEYEEEAFQVRRVWRSDFSDEKLVSLEQIGYPQAVFSIPAQKFIDGAEETPW